MCVNIFKVLKNFFRGVGTAGIEFFTFSFLSLITKVDLSSWVYTECPKDSLRTFYLACENLDDSWPCVSPGNYLPFVIW